MLENLPICVKKVTCYSVSVLALSCVAVDLGPQKREILRHAVSLSPNSCIFGFSTLKCTNLHPPLFSAWNQYVGAPGRKHPENPLRSADPEKPAHRETPKISAPVLKNMVPPPPMTHTSSKRPFLADFKKYTHKPPEGTKFWHMGPKVQKPAEKCQNPPRWHITNVPERYWTLAPGQWVGWVQSLHPPPQDKGLGAWC